MRCEINNMYRREGESYMGKFHHYKNGRENP